MSQIVISKARNLGPQFVTGCGAKLAPQAQNAVAACARTRIMDITDCDVLRMMTNALVKIPVERIEKAIYMIRGERVMLDRDLAELYGVETRALNQNVNRNRERFPDDFMFELTRAEIDGISQFVTSSNLRFSKRVTVFTEQGVAMLSSVLRSKRAVAVNVEIMRAFVRLRRLLASNAALARKIEALEQKYDSQFKVVFTAIKKLMLPPNKPKGGIGFISKRK